MDTLFKAKIEVAIQKALNDSAENGEDAWSHLIHPDLVKQMTNAAESVFDAAQSAQDYYEHENQ